MSGQSTLHAPRQAGDGSTHLIAPDPLSKLANDINAEAANAETCARNALLSALDVGRMLNDAKVLVEHGEWANWLTANVTLAARTASAYMRLAKEYPLLSDADRQRVTDLPVREAIHAIAMNPTAPTHHFNRPQYITRTDIERHVKALRLTSFELKKLTRAVDNGVFRPRDIERARKALEAALSTLNQIASTDANVIEVADGT